MIGWWRRRQVARQFWESIDVEAQRAMLEAGQDLFTHAQDVYNAYASTAYEISAHGIWWDWVETPKPTLRQVLRAEWSWFTYQFRRRSTWCCIPRRQDLSWMWPHGAF